MQPRLVISYIGRSGAVERLSVTPRTAARRWPELFARLAADVEKVSGRQLGLWEGEQSESLDLKDKRRYV